MASRRVLAVAICVGLLIGARLAWHQESVSAAPVFAEYQRPGATELPDVPAVESGDVGPNATRLDRYGNEINTAIGEYRVDPLGEMYERHSPDTALPRLLPPEV